MYLKYRNFTNVICFVPLPLEIHFESVFKAEDEDARCRAMLAVGGGLRDTESKD